MSESANLVSLEDTRVLNFEKNYFTRDLLSLHVCFSGSFCSNLRGQSFSVRLHEDHFHGTTS